ncbi:MAG: hypothetical protein IMZ71_00380 [Chloroflexi bacterium]|nr:hypothetical protein [Chloroflexota bacterium]
MAKKKDRMPRTFDGGPFEVFDIKVRRLRNGHKIMLVLEVPYSEKTSEQLERLRFQDVNVRLEEFIPHPEQPALPSAEAEEGLEAEGAIP